MDQNECMSGVKLRSLPLSAVTTEQEDTRDFFEALVGRKDIPQPKEKFTRDKIEKLLKFFHVADKHLCHTMLRRIESVFISHVSSNMTTEDAIFLVQQLFQLFKVHNFHSVRVILSCIDKKKKIFPSVFKIDQSLQIEEELNSKADGYFLRKLRSNLI